MTDRSGAKYKIIIILVISVILLTAACVKPPVLSEKSEKSAETAAGTAQAHDTARGGENIRALVLVRGNHWAPGISGFGSNSFPALRGEYRLFDHKPLTEEDPEREFSVYLTKEALYFPEEWQTRSGTGNIKAYQCSTEEGFHIAAILEEGRSTSWTAVFRFRQGLEKAGFDSASFNLMLRAWANKFIYFLSLSNSVDSVSLPAVVEF